MFTGIVDHCGVLVKIEHLAKGIRIAIQHHFTDLMLGESISVDGICLTVTSIEEKQLFHCDISPETLRITTAANFKIEQQLNLERALLPTSRIGGHFVMGHIDQTVRVQHIQQHHDFVEMTLTNLNALTQQSMLPKGSVTLNGVSLTINQTYKNNLVVMLVPYTLHHTNLSKLQENDLVNLEIDIIARAVAKQRDAYITNEE